MRFRFVIELLKRTLGAILFLFIANPYSIKALEKPLITTLITIGLCLMNEQFLFSPDANAFVLPYRKVITKLSLRASNIFLMIDPSNQRLIFLPSLHILFTVSAPSSLKNLLSIVLTVSSATTYFTFKKKATTNILVIPTCFFIP